MIIIEQNFKETEYFRKVTSLIKESNISEKDYGIYNIMINVSKNSIIKNPSYKQTKELNVFSFIWFNDLKYDFECVDDFKSAIIDSINIQLQSALNEIIFEGNLTPLFTFVISIDSFDYNIFKQLKIKEEIEFNNTDDRNKFINIISNYLTPKYMVGGVDVFYEFLSLNLDFNFYGSSVVKYLTTMNKIEKLIELIVNTEYNVDTIISGVYSFTLYSSLDKSTMIHYIKEYSINNPIDNLKEDKIRNLYKLLLMFS